MNLHYLGPEETFSHRAASRMQHDGEVLIPCATFREVFRKTAAQPDAAAVVPFENTSQGPVTEIMDLLVTHPELSVVECRSIPVHQHLLSRDLTTPVKRILSKAEALAQCRGTLSDLYPGISLEAVSSTAEAARIAAEDASVAAVAGASTAKRYGLAVRKADVQDIHGNTTRFFRLEHRSARRGEMPALPPTHSLIYAIIEDRPGSLLELLQPLKTIDLTFIQSRPIPGEKWKYAFYLELLTGASGIPLATLLSQIRPACQEVRLLGSYTITTQTSIPDPTTTTALSSLRAMIADLDASLIRAFAGRRAYRLNADLYVHAEPVSEHELARAFAVGDPQEQTRMLRRFYLTTVVPYLADRGDDPEPRQALHADTEAISALTRRLSFSKKVIARKRVELAPELRAAAETGSPDAVEAALLNSAVEEKVLARAHDFALREGFTEAQIRHTVDFYRQYLLPISRLIQVYVILESLE